jgi:hypothetical protein
LLALTWLHSVLATGLLLTGSLLITPAATAQFLTPRFRLAIGYAAGFTVFSVCLGLWLASQIFWFPIAFMTLSSFGLYLIVRSLATVVGSARRRSPRRRQHTRWRPLSRIDPVLARSTEVEETFEGRFGWSNGRGTWERYAAGG